MPDYDVRDTTLKPLCERLVPVGVGSCTALALGADEQLAAAARQLLVKQGDQPDLRQGLEKSLLRNDACAAAIVGACEAATDLLLDMPIQQVCLRFSGVVARGRRGGGHLVGGSAVGLSRTSPLVVWYGRQ